MPLGATCWRHSCPQISDFTFNMCCGAALKQNIPICSHEERQAFPITTSSLPSIIPEIRSQTLFSIKKEQKKPKGQNPHGGSFFVIIMIVDIIKMKQRHLWKKTALLQQRLSLHVKIISDLNSPGSDFSISVFCIHHFNYILLQSLCSCM